MNLLDLLADAASFLMDSSGAPGDPGWPTAGGAGPAAGGMGDGGPGSGGGGDGSGDNGGDGDDDDPDGDPDSSPGEDESSDEGDPDGSWDDVEESWEKAKEDMEEIFDEVFDIGERAARGELTEDEKIAWGASQTGGKDPGDLGLDAAEAAGVPGMGPAKAAKDATKYAEAGMRAGITGKKAKETRDFDKHHPRQHRGEIQDGDD